MRNDVTKQPMDLYEKYAAEASAVGGTRLKFVKGVFKIGDEVVDLNTEFVALMADVAQCWVRFENGKLTHSLLYKLADGFEPCQREELGDPESNLEMGQGQAERPVGIAMAAAAAIHRHRRGRDFYNRFGRRLAGGEGADQGI